MNANVKKVIKGVAKTAGKYTLKGIGKGAELAGRGTVKTVRALVRNPQLQKIVTGAGLLAAGVMVPTVGVGLISTLGMKYMFDNCICGKNKGLFDEMDSIINGANIVTKTIGNKILSPKLKKMDKKIKQMGRKYQHDVDDFFRTL